MFAELAILREMQELDQRIAELTREISELPKHIALIESRLESHRRRLEADKAALAANLKERKSLDDDVKQHEQKVSRLRDQMMEVKTNEQYRAFQHEIDFEQQAIRKIEDQILERMGEAETLDQNVKVAENELKKEAADVEREKKAVQQRTDADRAELAATQQRRNSSSVAVASKTLAAYERLRRTRGGIAIAEVRDGRCLVCNVILRLSYLQQLRTSQEALVCEACGRILYYDPDAPAEESPKATAECPPETAEPLPSAS